VSAHHLPEVPLVGNIVAAHEVHCGWGGGGKPFVRTSKGDRGGVVQDEEAGGGDGEG